ncbi:response regulator [Gramella lutea]|uniref:Response regulator n=1 Tax=Christiangramia lutea TaxID=1607951 RepID=A0A9X1V0K8_9FLAO|nr:response regulator [Christiangramia lutea]MCH4821970.1 response regulator [Christiangramia lutea]
MIKSVWVIDDDEIYQMIIKKLIGRSQAFDEEHYYKCVLDVFKDLESPDFQLPDVIFLDINMPQMDGWQFIERLRELCPDLSAKCNIYIVSSSIAYSDKERAKKYPEISNFLSKPVSVEVITEIAEAVNKKTRCRDQA